MRQHSPLQYVGKTLAKFGGILMRFGAAMAFRERASGGR
jgi:hypothetical protein